MTYVVKDNRLDKFLIFDRGVRGMTIYNIVHLAGSQAGATSFRSEDAAKLIIKECQDTGVHDMTDVSIIDTEAAAAEQEAKAKENADKLLKASWENTSLEKRREMLGKMKESKREEWLNEMGDTSGITPMTPRELAEREAEKLGKKLGFSLTEDQIKEIENKYNNMEENDE